VIVCLVVVDIRGIYGVYNSGEGFLAFIGLNLSNLSDNCVFMLWMCLLPHLRVQKCTNMST